jgi:hypothetical protein
MDRIGAITIRLARRWGASWIGSKSVFERPGVN